MSDTSILSFEQRGKWGNAKWRGNCSGHIYGALFDQYKGVKSFCDPFMGSGTSIEVAQERGIEAFGLDLHMGFNILKHSIVETIGKEVDMVFSHPAYHDMITYSNGVWGDTPHPDDLSRCSSIDDFNEKLHLAMLNQREATKPGGLYGMLIGDMRRNGRYTSFQAEAIARLPAEELTSVIIKAQHNTMSGRNTYVMKHMPIMHEYILLWTKPNSPLSLLVDLSKMAKQQATKLTSVWRNIVRHAMISLGGKASLSDLYEKVAKNAPENLAKNENWQAKVRQTLQTYKDFNSCERGVWALA